MRSLKKKSYDSSLATGISFPRKSVMYGDSLCKQVTLYNCIEKDDNCKWFYPKPFANNAYAGAMRPGSMVLLCYGWGGCVKHCNNRPRTTSIHIKQRRAMASNGERQGNAAATRGKAIINKATPGGSTHPMQV